MNQFTLRPGSRGRLCKAIFFRYAGIACLTACLTLLVSLSNVWPFEGSFPDVSNLTIPGVMLLLMLLWDLSKAMAIASAFKLTISQDTITSESKSIISIPVKEVRGITRYTDGSYVILGENALRPITIPVSIEREEEMEKVLTAVTGLDIQSQNFQWYQLYLLAFAFLVLLLGAFFVDNQYLATGLGVAFAGGLLYCWGVLQWGNPVDKKIRRLSHLTLVLVLAVMIRIIWLWIE